MNVATFEQINQTVLDLLGRVDINTNMGAVVYLLYRTGLRVEEAVQLKRFTIGTSTFTIDTEKKSLDRTFDIDLLPSAYYPMLEKKVSPISLWNISSITSITRFIQRWSPIMFYKNQKYVNTNIFRYRYARNLQEEGYSLEQIQEAMGHSSEQSTLKYLEDLYYDEG